jgi:hypothetical protein
MTRVSGRPFALRDLMATFSNLFKARSISSKALVSLYSHDDLVSAHPFPLDHYRN